MKIEINKLSEFQEVILQDTQELTDVNMPPVKSLSPLNIEARVTKIKDTVDIKVTANTDVILQCSRCLNEVGSRIERKMRLDFLIKPDERELDITEDIRQELIIEYPMKFLCSPSCKGLCQKCGKNLNEGDCGCK